MTVYFVQLIAIIIAAIALFLLLLEIAGIGIPHLSDLDNFWTGSPPSHPSVFFEAPMTVKILILAGLIAAGLLALELTYFDVCGFLWFWFPEMQVGLPPRCPYVYSIILA